MPNLLSHDPLRQKFPFSEHEEFFPLGFSLIVESNDKAVIEAARRSFGGNSPHFDAPPMRVSVAVQPGEGAPGPVEFRGLHHLFSIVLDTHNYAVADLRAGVAYAWLTPGVAAAADWFRHRMLESIVYSMLVQDHLTPIHCSCVARDSPTGERLGLLLCAPPGTGKSSLAYACALRGWTFITDDAAYLINSSTDNLVLGKPASMRFKASGVGLFPELSHRPRTPDLAGEDHVEVALETLPRIAQANACRAHRLVFLERKPGPARLIPLHRDDALNRLLSDIPLYEPRVRANHRAALERLVKHEPLILSYPEYTVAIPLLESLVC